MAVTFLAARRLAAFDAALFGIGLWLAGPLSIAKLGGTYDDYLFVRLANFLLRGDWLGPFDRLTLAKGPFYPLFLAGAVCLGVPVQVAVETVYLLGALLLARVAGTLAGKPGIGTLCFALLALNPACFDWYTTMLMREPLYCGLTLLVLGLSAKILLCGGRSGWPVCLGAAAAALWLTREEGLALAPPLLLMLGWYFRAPLAGLWQRVRRRPILRGLPKNPVWPPAAAGLVALGLVLSVCTINQHAYGVFRSNDFQSGPFPRAYGALTRILPAAWQRLTPVPRDARLAAYAVSPAFAELKPFIEGDSAHFTTDVECDITPRPACHDIPGASFMWALRDAVERAGHYGSAKQADRFYRRLAREIEGACARGALTCTGPRRGYLPPLRMGYGLPLLRGLWRVGADTIWLGHPTPLSIPSTLEGELATAYDALSFATPIGPPKVFADAPGWQISGDVSSTDATASLAVTSPLGGAETDLRVTPSGTINAAFHRTGPISEVFHLDVRCPAQDCSLGLISGGRVVGFWSPAALRHGMLLDTQEAMVYIESVSLLPPISQALNAGSLRRTAMRTSARFLPYLTGLGVLPILAWLGWRLIRRPGHGLTLLAVVLFVTVATRIGMLALLEATSFESQSRYEAPSMGPLLCLAALMLGDLAGVRRKPWPWLALSAGESSTP